MGRGLSHCASCDGSFFMEKPVIVVGGGDAAVDEALHLTQYASSVTVLHRRDTLRACASLQERARSERKLSFRWNTALRAIEGADGVERVQVEDLTTGKTDAVPASGVFIYAGLTPNTEFLGGLVPLDDARADRDRPPHAHAGPGHPRRGRRARRVRAPARDLGRRRGHRRAGRGPVPARPPLGRLVGRAAARAVAEWDAGRDAGAGLELRFLTP